jgi:hypothetical protein
MISVRVFESVSPMKVKVIEDRDLFARKWTFSFDVSDLWRTDPGLLADELRLFGIKWLSPIVGDSGVWLLDADAMRDPDQDPRGIFCLPLPPSWLRGKIRVRPVFPASPSSSPQLVRIEFPIQREDALIQNHFGRVDEPSNPLRAFLADYEEPERVGFLMMRFEESRLHGEIVAAVKAAAQDQGLTVVRADDKRYSDDLLTNIETYMHGCGFGIAVFERLSSSDFNPNVSLEVGYMMALGKPVCLLRDSTLPSLQTDLVGRLYETFDTQNPKETIQGPLMKWFGYKGLDRS